MTVAKAAPKHARKASAKPKRPAAKHRRVSKKTAAKRRVAPVVPEVIIRDNEEALAAREERHGMIEEAIEPPPSRGGHDIERE